MMAPAVILLLGWMLAPLTTTLYFSFKKYLPLRGGDLGWVGFDNYTRFVTSSSFLAKYICYINCCWMCSSNNSNIWNITCTTT